MYGTWHVHVHWAGMIVSVTYAKLAIVVVAPALNAAPACENARVDCPQGHTNGWDACRSVCLCGVCYVWKELIMLSIFLSIPKRQTGYTICFSLCFSFTIKYPPVPPSLAQSYSHLSIVIMLPISAFIHTVYLLTYCGVWNRLCVLLLWLYLWYGCSFLVLQFCRFMGSDVWTLYLVGLVNTVCVNAVCVV